MAMSMKDRPVRSTSLRISSVSRGKSGSWSARSRRSICTSISWVPASNAGLTAQLAPTRRMAAMTMPATPVGRLPDRWY